MGVTLHTYTHNELNWDAKLVPLSGGGDSDLERIRDAINVAADISSTDLNSLVLSGVYSGSTLGNSPDGTTGSFTIWVAYKSTVFASQIAIKNTTGVTYRRTLGAGPAWSAWKQVVDETNIQAIIGDTGWVTSSTGITAASGFTLTSSKYRIRNGRVDIGFIVTRSGSAIAGGSSTGNVANTNIINLPALLVPSSSSGKFQAGGAGTTAAAWGYFSNGASAAILTVASSGGIPTNAVLDCQGDYSL